MYRRASFRISCTPQTFEGGRQNVILEPINIKALYTQESETPKLKVAAYARVSTEQDEQQSSYEAQVDYYRKYICSNPEWKFVGIYADEGITGTNTKNVTDLIA